MDRRLRNTTTGALLLALVSGTLGNGAVNASETKPVYVATTTSAATLTQILASGDKVGSSSQWQGIPDGMGGVKNANGTVSVFVNHELSASDAFTAKTEREYGGYGSTISKVTVNKTGTQVTKIENAIKKVTWFDYSEGKYSDTPVGPVDAPDALVDPTYGTTPLHTTALNRFCSATLVEAGGLNSDYSGYQSKIVTLNKEVNVRYVIEINGKNSTVVGKQVKKIDRRYWKNSAGKWVPNKVRSTITAGTSSPIFITGEEGGDESRIFALETRTGELVQLPALGLGASENISIAGNTDRATVAMIGEDGAANDSQLFMYKGTKSASGTWAERAGLTNGKRYVASISSLVNSATTTPAGASVAANAAIANDVIARGAIAPVTITSAERGRRGAKSSAIVIADGTATVTASNTFIAGEIVSIAGLSDAQKAGIDDLTQVQITAATATTYKFMTNAADAASTPNSSIVATPSTRTVLVITSGAHNLLEGDKVALSAVSGGLSGKFSVVGVPTGVANKFIVRTSDWGRTTFGVTADSKVTRLLDVEFKQVSTDIAGDAQQTQAKLRGTEFARVEDGAFNPANKNEYFFITTQTDSDGTGYTDNTGGGLWKLTFVNVSKPELGATIELILDGSEIPSATTGDASPAKILKLDNLTFSAKGTVVFLQEDPGGNSHVARLLALRLSDEKLVTVAKFDSNMFGESGTAANVNAYLTNDEESSGIFDATKLFGGSGSTFMFNAQVHPLTKAAGITWATDGSADGQIARSAAVLRPDLMVGAQDLTISGASVGAIASSKRYLTLTLSGVSANTNNDGFVATGGTTTILSANDVINVRGLTAKFNGTYAVTSIDLVAGTIDVELKADSSTDGPVAVVGTGRIIVSDGSADKDFKTNVLEGGALYTLKIPSLSALFN